MKIVEVSEQYEISTHTLRYYERIGLIPPINRNKSDIRDYVEIDTKKEILKNSENCLQLECKKCKRHGTC
jgi:DNA-binding transcriptional MerR regulator